MSTVEYQGAWEPEAFAGSTFIAVNFSNRCLAGANFSGSVCKECDFSDSDLSMADFTGADLYGCTFTRSVLYGAKLDNANLTRANFQMAFIYGWLLNSSVNITYAKILSFDLESRRRSASFSNSADRRSMTFGQEISDTADLCQDDYQAGDATFSFGDLDGQESALQRAQIFNRLKRLYRENHDGQTALHCQFLERYYLTRSRFKQSALTENRNENDATHTLIRTGLSYAAEHISGYGLRPLRILRSIAVLFAIFLVSTCLISSLSDNNGVIYQGPTIATGSTKEAGRLEVVQTTVDLEKRGIDVERLAQFSALSILSPEHNQFTSYGILLPISIVYFGISASLLALLFSSIFVRLLSE